MAKKFFFVNYLLSDANGMIDEKPVVLAMNSPGSLRQPAAAVSGSPDQYTLIRFNNYAVQMGLYECDERGLVFSVSGR